MLSVMKGLAFTSGLEGGTRRVAVAWIEENPSGKSKSANRSYWDRKRKIDSRQETKTCTWVLLAVVSQSGLGLGLGLEPQCFQGVPPNCKCINLGTYIGFLYWCDCMTSLYIIKHLYILVHFIRDCSFCSFFFLWLILHM